MKPQRTGFTPSQSNLAQYFTKLIYKKKPNRKAAHQLSLDKSKPKYMQIVCRLATGLGSCKQEKYYRPVSYSSRSVGY